MHKIVLAKSIASILQGKTTKKIERHNDFPACTNNEPIPKHTFGMVALPMQI